MSACGRAVTSIGVGGCADLNIDGRNGFPADRDVDAIREKFLFFHDDREAPCRIGRRNGEIVEERWSWQLCARDWLDFIKANL